MYQPMLYLHWKQIRIVLIPFVIAAFGLPLLSVQGFEVARGSLPADALALHGLDAVQVWVGAFPALAVAIGVTLALSSWNWDHQLNHVYSLSLPISRWEYAVTKMGAGAVLALLPAGAFWVGSLVATASVHLPIGLHAYPNGLALRFLLSVLVSYALVFALAAGTIRTTVIVLSTLAAFFLVGAGIQSYLAVTFPSLHQMNVVNDVAHILSLTGPFAVFTGSWALIDV
jgi:hypothetical protein